MTISMAPMSELRFHHRWIPVLAYSALILSFSSISTLPAVPSQSDKIVHFVEYLIYAALLWRALAGKPLKRRAILTFLPAVAFAALDETYQAFVPGRVSSIYDWLFDVAGISGMITFMIIEGLRKNNLAFCCRPLREKEI